MLLPLRAIESNNCLYRNSWMSDNFEENQNQRTDSKRKQRRSRAITLKEAIEKSSILLPIIFLPTTVRFRTGESEWQKWRRIINTKGLTKTY